MPTIFDFLYQQYCRARLAEMRKQLLLSPQKVEDPDLDSDNRENSIDKTTEGHQEARVH